MLTQVAEKLAEEISRRQTGLTIAIDQRLLHCHPGKQASSDTQMLLLYGPKRIQTGENRTISAKRHSFGEKERVQCAVSAQHANEKAVCWGTSSSSCGGVATRP